MSQIIKLKEIFRDDWDSDWWEDKSVELKKWSLEDISNLNITISGATPRYRLEEAGYVCEASIDVKELFGDYLEKDPHGSSRVNLVSNTCDGWKSRPWTPAKGARDLRLVKDKLEKILDELDYKNRELIIYRTYKGGMGNWDYIEVFSEKRVPVFWKLGHNYPLSYP